MNLIKVAIFIGISFGVSVWAQDSKKGMPFTCILWEELPFEDIFIPDGDSGEQLKLKKKRRSETYFLKTRGQFQLFIKPDTSEDLDPKPILVGESIFDTSARRMLFILKAAPEGAKLPINIIAIEDSFETFPPGSFRFVNFSTQNMLTKIGDKRVVLNQKSIEVMKPRMPKNGGLVAMIVYDENGSPVFGRRLFGQAQDRKMVIFVDSGKSTPPVEAIVIPHLIPKPEKSNL